jgi:hypothetical protein
MASFDVGVWISEEQYNDTGTQVLNRVVTYLENSTGNISHSINAVAKDERIYAPEECPHTSFSTDFPCDGNLDSTSYDQLYSWWVDYTDYCDLNLEADANLLVTNCSGSCGGGTGGGTRAVANGNRIENPPSSWTKYENSCGAYSMGTVLQEVGHCLVNGVSDSDGDGHGEHDTCDTTYQSGDYYSTPMGVGYHDELDDKNECEDIVTDPTGSKYVDFEFDSCAGAYM